MKGSDVRKKNKRFELYRFTPLSRARRFYTEEAKELNKHGTVVVEGVASLDHSPPESVPHVEYRGLENIRNYIDMPNRVVRIEQKVDSLVKSLETLTDRLNQIVEPLSKLVTFTKARTEEIKNYKIVGLHEAYKLHEGKPAHLRCIEKIDSAQRE